MIAMQNKKSKKEEILTLLNVLGDYFSSYEKSGHVAYSKQRTYGNPTEQRISYATCANLSQADSKSTSNE